MERCARITAHFDGTTDEARAALDSLAGFVLAESGHGPARLLAAELEAAQVDVVHPWHCASCNDSHDGATPALHHATARASHDGAEVVTEVYGCAQYSAATLHRAAASIARELLASLKGDA